jgi:hypothetical protein
MNTMTKFKLSLICGFKMFKRAWIALGSIENIAKEGDNIIVVHEVEFKL